MPADLVRTVVRLFLLCLVICLVIAGCSSTPESTPASEPATAVRVEPVRASKSRQEVMADKLLAALASGDADQLRPLFSREGWVELESIARTSFHKLRARLDEEGLDLAKAKIRVVTSGDRIEMVDVHLDFEGKRYRTHFSAMGTDDYQLLGLANWLKRE